MPKRAKLKRKSFFIDERALHRAKKALRVKTNAEVIRVSVERIAEMEKFWKFMKKSRGALRPRSKRREQYPTSLFDALKKRILAKHPKLKKESPERARREFEKTTAKIRRSLPFKTWKEMDRFVKGDRFGIGRL